MKKTIFDVMEDIRAVRLKKERVAIMRERQAIAVEIFRDYSLKLSVNEVIPEPVDVCDAADFRTIIQDTPIDIKVNKKSFENAIKRLPLLIQEWRSVKEAELLRIINSDFTLDSDHQQLELATTFFGCRICQSAVQYPGVLMHRCLRVPRPFYNHQDDIQNMLWASLKNEPWNYGGDRVNLNIKAIGVARQLVKCFEMDPNTTTAQEMDKIGGIVECIPCEKLDSTKRLAMDWRNAVSCY